MEDILCRDKITFRNHNCKDFVVLVSINTDEQFECTRGGGVGRESGGGRRGGGRKATISSNVYVRGVSGSWILVVYIGITD